MWISYEHDEAATKLGAVRCASSFYPPKRNYYSGEVTSVSTFSVHYFNKDGGEVGFFLPDFVEFHPPGALHTFDPPRQWGEEALQKLGDWRDLKQKGEDNDRSLGS